MLPMSTTWPWSLQPCGTSGIELHLKIFKIPLMLLAFAILSFVILPLAILPLASASTIQSGPDIQAAISSASPGDTILVGAGDYSPFQIDKPLNIQGIDGPRLRAAIQKPAIIINTDGASISGFKIEGVGKDPVSKFNYYMEHPQAASGMQLDLPNAAIIVRGNDALVRDIAIFGAQVGVFAESATNLSLENNTFESCERGAEVLSCHSGRIENNSFTNCDKSGIDVEHCRLMIFANNSIINTTNAGLMLKESENCRVQDNLLSANKEGLAVWNSSFNDIRRNRADHSYYGIFLAGANNNTVIDNQAVENSNPDVVGGFGMGISLLENSSYNVVARNTAREDFNGIELTRGCKFNAVYANNLSDNKHGIRLDKNYDNLVYGNNFVRNTISGYDNASRNIWNTTFGNYYSDYQGKDENGDGLGDQPYPIPKGDHDEADARPLVRPFSAVTLDVQEIMSEVKKYAKFGPPDDEIPDIRVEKGTIVIESRRPTSPPKWPESKPLM